MMKPSERILKERFYGGCAVRAGEWADEVEQLEEAIRIIMQSLDIDTDQICHTLRQNDLMKLVDIITER